MISEKYDKAIAEAFNEATSEIVIVFDKLEMIDQHRLIAELRTRVKKDD